MKNIVITVLFLSSMALNNKAQGTVLFSQPIMCQSTGGHFALKIQMGKLISTDHIYNQKNWVELTLFQGTLQKQEPAVAAVSVIPGKVPGGGIMTLDAILQDDDKLKITETGQQYFGGQFSNSGSVIDLNCKWLPTQN